jgi:hypothetical protein
VAPVGQVDEPEPAIGLDDDVFEAEGSDGDGGGVERRDQVTDTVDQRSVEILSRQRSERAADNRARGHDRLPIAHPVGADQGRNGQPDSLGQEQEMGLVLSPAKRIADRAGWT